MWDFPLPWLPESIYLFKGRVFWFKSKSGMTIPVPKHLVASPVDESLLAVFECRMPRARSNADFSSMRQSVHKTRYIIAE